MRRAIPGTVITGLVALGLSVFAAGAALAVSGGPYSPPSQDCPYYASAWNAPQDQTYPGCHNTQLTVESGGTTDGNPNNGYNDSRSPGDHGAKNTTWVQFGNNQAPNDPQSQGTPGLLSIGYPGQSGSPHAGCLSANTDGTNGGPAPAGTKSTSPGKAARDHKYGCGNNPKGTGFALNYDYYPYYCPAAASVPGYPYKCERVPGGDQGTNTFTLDTGGQQNLTDVLSRGLIVYFGMDDNNDNGEHDGEGASTSRQSQGSINGSSDGGAFILSFTPQTATATPTTYRPEALVNFSMGFCADGNCIAATTQRETIYQGCDANTGENQAQDQCTGANGPHSSRDVYNYSGKQWDPYNCSSGGGSGQSPEPDAPASCDTSKSNPSPSGSKNPNGGESYWRQHEAHDVYAEPGLQVYEDPDAEGSPAGPIYPNPAFYVGTCGVVLGGGVAPMPASPVTNKAGQLDVSTGC
jgi:hypothetical protein